MFLYLRLSDNISHSEHGAVEVGEILRLNLASHPVRNLVEVQLRAIVVQQEPPQ